MEILLSAKNISKTFQGRRVLDNIDIEINIKSKKKINISIKFLFRPSWIGYLKIIKRLIFKNSATKIGR